MSIADLVRALRERLGLTQEDLAERAKAEHPSFDRVYVSKIEAGTNKATSAKMRDGLAAAFGLSRGDLEDYLSERISVDEAVRRMRATPKTPHEAPKPGAFNHALAEAFRAGRFEVDDLDAVRSVFRSGHEALAAEDDPVQVASVLLRCASELRRDGRPVTADTIIVRMVRVLSAQQHKTASPSASSSTAATPTRKVANG